MLTIDSGAQVYLLPVRIVWITKKWISQGILGKLLEEVRDNQICMNQPVTLSCVQSTSSSANTPLPPLMGETEILPTEHTTTNHKSLLTIDGSSATSVNTSAQEATEVTQNMEIT